MDTLDYAKLKKLASLETDPAVTIYLPLHTTASPPHISENQIRFKNLVHRAVQQLPTDGSGREVAKALEAQLAQLHDDLGFWEAPKPGLLLCAAPGVLEMFYLPIDTEEYVAVDRAFHLAPVLGLLHDARNFYVLALAQHNPKIYSGTLYGLEPLNLRLPVDAKAAFNIDEVNQQVENQGTAAGPSSQGMASGQGAGRGWFNGRGGARNTEAEERLKYWRIVDHMINETVDRSLPLVLAGTDEETAAYRSISRYPHLLHETIAGNHRLDDVKSLFGLAWAKVWHELVVPEHRAALQEYLQMSGATPDRALHDTKHIAAAARQGRIDKLLTRLTSQTSDTVQDSIEDLPRLTFPTLAESKHLNEVALQVWRSSGTIYNLLPEEMPDGTLMAASLRY